MVYNVLDIARYVINYANEKGTPISNIKLQKILYYIQAKFLVEENEKCFEEDVVNWTYGPVIEKAYNEFRTYGHRIICKQDKYQEIEFDEKSRSIQILEKNFDESKINNKDRLLIQEVIDKYISFEPFKLVKKTHEENPWKDTRQNEIITVESIKKYYCENKEKL